MEQDVLELILRTIKKELSVLNDCYDERIVAEIIGHLVIAYNRLKNSEV